MTVFIILFVDGSYTISNATGGQGVLTCSSAKKQSLALIRKFNFEISSALISMLWCLKYIDIWLTLIWGPNGG